MPGKGKAMTAADYTCRACGQKGHGARSPQCPKRAKPGPAAKKPAPKPVPAARPAANGHAPDVRAVPTGELVAALRRAADELERRLGVLDQVAEALGAPAPR